MDEWVLWMIAAGVLAVGEMFTMGFFARPDRDRGGASRRSCRWRAGASLLQWIVFIAASLGSLAVLRPIAKRHLRTPSQLRTGTAALVGAPALVLERVDGRGGQVKIGGEVWSARAYDEDDAFEPGARVEVMKIDGATALVAE